MRVRVIAIALVLALSIPSTQVGAKSDVIIGDDLYVEWDPHILDLAPGEEGDIIITVHGNRKSTTMIGIRWNFIDGPGGPDGDATPNYFELGSHDEREVTVHVRSRAVRGIDDCASDVRLTFYWGPNLTMTGTDGFDRDTADGWEDLKIHVTDDFSPGPIGDIDEGMDIIFIIIIAILLVIIAILIARLYRDKQ